MSWHKIIEGDEKEYPSKSTDTICDFGDEIYEITWYEDKKFYTLEHSIDVTDDIVRWHEIPTDEKCKWYLDDDMSMKSQCKDKYQLQWKEYKYCPYCSKEIEFV